MFCPPTIFVGSFAMLMFEVLTRTTPFGDLKQWDIPDAVEAGKRPDIPPNSPLP